jgi:transposase-like protein
MGHRSSESGARSGIGAPIWTPGWPPPSAPPPRNRRCPGRRCTRVGNRHPNPRLVKLHRNYSVEEIARLFDLHKNTVRHWLKQGLAAIDDRRPRLVPRQQPFAVPAGAPAEGQAAMRAGTNLLRRVPRPQSAGRADGRMHPHRTPDGESARHLPPLRPAHLPPRQSRENRCRARRTGDHVHAAALTHKREPRPLREL